MATTDSKLQLKNSRVRHLTNAGKGRKKGVPNKVTAQLKDMILGALDQAGGTDYLKRKARTHPAAFMALIGRILPMQVEGKLEHTVSDQLQRALERRRNVE